jgi:hypothetical protein
MEIAALVLVAALAALAWTYLPSNSERGQDGSDNEFHL